MTGARITAELPSPIEISLRPLRNVPGEGAEMPSFLSGSIPLFRNDVVEAMQRAGVDNLELFATVLFDPDDGKSHRSYQAVNILGLIAAADFEQSEAIIHGTGPRLIDVDFNSLVLDTTKTHGALLFRLAEAVNGVLVHEKLKRALLADGFDDLQFLDPRRVAL